MRECPKCFGRITYKSKYDYLKSESRGSKCKTCSCRENAEICKELFKGEGNPFHGKIHSKETREKMSAVDRSWMTGSLNPMKNDETKAYFSEKYMGNGNPNFGKSMSDERKKQYSLRFSGKGNPMYGKPSPQGSGNGWANWYRGRHFRSIRELQYFISEVDGKGISCESAQGKRFKILYTDWNGVERTYRPDFFVENHWLVEVKPKKLWNTNSVVSKKEAAEKFCKEKGYEYRLVDIEPNSSLLREKYLNGEIKFVEKYRERFEKYAGIKLCK